ncbi:adenosylcobinamide-GDP ribazoletransferase [Cyanobium sp. HWJ4-Hawea]|uniref:adenosylcobinamide-GDP ribazoletransferase n=1 Tax=Cyanobium sp. HWJ4-Hawea TaxID=2823713 RepID=UPI00396568F3|nr:adenosylcobinamide-GDP ribazoletransferase [Cyanobium sp. HWJ4-Hawea]
MLLKTRLKGGIRDGAGAWVFYSVLPAWPGVEPRFERIARFAPLVGLVLGLVQASFWWLTAAWLPLAAQVPLVIALGVLLTGGLHLDGAMDTADGLAAGPRRALEAMQDSRVGASGVQAMVLLLLLKVAAFACLAQAAPVALLWAALWGRVSPLFAMAAFAYLRPEGGSAAFHRSHWLGLPRELGPALVAAGLLLAGLLVAGVAAPLLWMGLLAGVPALLVPLWLGRRLGGHSGDSYGACVEWSEALALLLCGLLVRLLGLGG